MSTSASADARELFLAMPWRKRSRHIVEHPADFNSMSAADRLVVLNDRDSSAILDGLLGMSFIERQHHLVEKPRLLAEMTRRHREIFVSVHQRPRTSPLKAKLGWAAYGAAGLLMSIQLLFFVLRIIAHAS